METLRLTMAQALVKHLQAQFIVMNGVEVPLFGGAWAIFGHGNVAGMGEALAQVKDQFTTFRAHNEQGMALAACAYAKQHRRQRIMACTSSIGPGATNMITAAGLAMANRLPVLFLPGDVFATRTPDPVLQQVEHFNDPTLSVNDCFRPVSRYFDRINRPEQLITSLPAAINTMLDPVTCGPATLALPQDVQTMAFDFPTRFFTKKVHTLRRNRTDLDQLTAAVDAIKAARKPLILLGGGVHYSLAVEEAKAFVEQYQIPACETQAGKGALAWDHPLNLGSVGVTGSSAANKAAQEADLIIAIGTRLQDFTSASRTLFANPNHTLLSINITPFDAEKHNALPLVGDAKSTLEELRAQLTSGWKAPTSWSNQVQALNQAWLSTVDEVTALPAQASNKHYLPTDANVIGVINRFASTNSTIVQAAGGLPGELHKLWRTSSDLGYHVEYGFSCMGYELAGGLGVKMATPERDVIVMVGDGSYLMLNSEIATSVMLGLKLTIVVLDNRGYACINRLQQACGGEPFNNLLQNCHTVDSGAPKTDFAAHAKALGAASEQVACLADLEAALVRAKASDKTYVIAIDTDPMPSTQEGGAWWDVAVPEVSSRDEVKNAERQYKIAKQMQPY
ncbi:3D-(3,5/4)-trihydroxycyclohexane-1,2-dione acylhydrolase (decyclizing) [Marinomonas profundimaris]|uniref:3D-(3,5/4)-trihydroxycyclohexane-1,2-dione hydrolase n=1 Tax=Marinomonas profundimaris TaxID=1208321 RepID=W1RPS1_9GAMM|nr:3D-(3,5/4)-trihydroxycyclohexane-1,2-dione acylhydrolase (decyclizing) [Marinomonas profundimaris]ETI58672.1 3D-(3,5/4)-trihydroxycyclohexane-1,2-dione hydrolase [Marinomonas profundimaris]